MPRGPSFWNGSNKSSPKAGTTGGTLATKAGATSTAVGAVTPSTEMEGEVSATKAGTAGHTETVGVVLKAVKGLATVEIAKGALGTILSKTEVTFPGVDVELQGAGTKPTCEKEGEGVVNQPGRKKGPPSGDIPTTEPKEEGDGVTKLPPS